MGAVHCPHVTFSTFPAIMPFREFPYNYARRFNEYVWDFALRPPSRMSMHRHVRDRRRSPLFRTMKLPAFVFAKCHLHRALESLLERALLQYPRSPEAVARLRAARPDLLITMGPHRYEEPAVVAAAKQLKIPTMAFITSWDNISTKTRLVFSYDAFLLWSDRMKAELHEFYPASRSVPAYVVGAPQFDVFHLPRFRQTKGAFCYSQGLRADLPIIVYALGSPNFVQERYAARQLVVRVARGDFGNAQLLLRPHPLFDDGELANEFSGHFPRVVVQRTGTRSTPLAARSQDESDIAEWVNTFVHADVVVNLASTVTVDAALCGRPIVNLDFDPEPGHPNQQLVNEVNHYWTHFKPIAESGGVWSVRNYDEMATAISQYLATPGLHAQQRRSIPSFVCGYTDGQCGKRMGRAILSFLHNVPHRTQFF
jgi:hypothetical protein